MKSKLILSIIVILGLAPVFGFLFAQPVNNKLKDVVMPAPNAASLGRYGDIPVSYFTGVPNIAIPLYTIQEGPLSVPISLSYHAAGIKPGEPASWVGTGWSLNAGGMVTRSILGLRDEGTNGYYHTGKLNDENTEYNLYANGDRDSEPDIFNFNFNGYSGKFVLDTDNVVFLIPKQDIKITYVYNSFEFERFTITTPDGTRYHFGNVPNGTTNEGIEVSHLQGSLSGASLEDYNSTWNLVQIETYDSKWKINFFYADEQYSYTSLGTCNAFGSKCFDEYGNQTSNYPSFSCSGELDNTVDKYLNRMSMSGKRLTKIQSFSQSQTVDFIPSNASRSDLDRTYVYGTTNTSKNLREIRINDGSFGMRWVFSYDYFLDKRNTTRSEYKRLKLNQIWQRSWGVSVDTTQELPKYEFYYEGPTNPGGTKFFPNRLTKAIDHWGFYNGANANNSTSSTEPNIPTTTLVGPNVTKGASDRETHYDSLKVGVLNRIKYPTGGSTYFTFEANKGKARAPVTDNLVNITNCSSANSSCCLSTNLQRTVNMVFTQEQINHAEFDLKLFSVDPQDPIHCGSGCQCSGTLASITLTATDLTTNSTVGSFGFNVTIPDGHSYSKLPLSTLEVNDYFVPGHNYQFTMSVVNGKGTFLMWANYGSYTGPDKEIGGLRIKQIKHSPKIAPSGNDVIRTYDYVLQSDGTTSSGQVIGYPSYGYWVAYSLVPSGSSVDYFFPGYSVVPMSDYEGYHIGYSRIVENFNGIGSKVYEYKTNYYPAFNVLPAPPALAAVDNGTLIREAWIASNGTTVKSENKYYPVPLQYSYMPGFAIKLLSTPPIPVCGAGQPLSILLPYEYKPRTGAYQVKKSENVLDEVMTTTNFFYDPAKKHLMPVKTEFYNSDGKKITTKTSYPTTLNFQCLREDLVARNIIGIPTSTKNYVDNVLVSGDSTRWTNWAASTGQPNGSCVNNGTGTDKPYPWEFYSYEMTYDASGNAVSGASWVRKGVIDVRWVLNSLPKKFTQTCGTDNTCWKPEFYEWSPSGLITKRTFNNDAVSYKNFVTQYDYYANGTTANGTRLLNKITSIDGQFQEFEYDLFMRLSKQKAKKSGAIANVQTDFTYSFNTPNADINYIKTKTAFTAASGSSLTEKTVWQYVDGLGRPVQTIDQKHSPDQKDVVVTTEYDNQGRAFKVYEPFEQNQTTGAFVNSPPGGQLYTLTEFHPDPLSRVWKVTPPVWYPTIYTYSGNLQTNVMLNLTPGSWYPQNSLNQTTVEDPNGNSSFTFTDKKGRVILSRRRNNNGTLEANTYNQYDNKDRLKTVVPPGAAASDANLIFSYLYDAANNMTMKDVPDASPVNMKYNKRDLLALLQDGNMASTSTWLGTKYDVYGNPVKTGFATGTDANTFTISSTNLLTETFYNDTINSSIIFKGKIRHKRTKVLGSAVATFLTTDYTYDAHGRVSTSYSNNHTGGNDNYTFTYDWADNRLSSTRNHRRLSGGAYTNVTETTTYDHAGRVKLNKHRLGSATEVTLSQLKYNAKDELIEKDLGVGATNTLQSLDYTYNAQGWLTAINQSTLVPTGTSLALPVCPTMATTMPTPAAGSTLDEKDLFYLELKYDGQFTGMTANDSLQKNGNINQMMWRTRGRERQAYNFSYDYLDRLRSAAYADVNDAGTVNLNSRYNESLTYADARGNIANLKRRGGMLNPNCYDFNQIDNLTYNYTAGTNRISSISDSAPATWKDKGFKDGSTSSYVYDANGNMTFDPDKGLTITYNHLNLPKTFNFGGGKVIDILYDAAGNKLRKSIIGSANNYTQEYIGGIEYRGTALEAIYTTEGRLFNNAGTFRYEYTIKDHLGNTRISFSDINGNGTIDYATEVLQENHYYPFGLSTEGPWKNDAALDNKYQYNGKEWNDDFGLNLNDYGARWYDASVGRWWSVDPLSQNTVDVNPFNYGLNCPILFIDPNGLASVYNWESGSYEDENGKEVSWENVKKEYSISEHNPEQNAFVISNELGSDKAQKNMLEAASKNSGNLQVFQVKNARDAARQLGAAYERGEINNLFLNSHGGYKNASFDIGSTTYSTADGVKSAKNLRRIGRLVSEEGNIVILACHTGSPDNGGVKLTKSVAEVTQRTTFSNQSWTCTYSTSFTGTWWGLFATCQDGKCGMGKYTESERPNAYKNMGKWTRVSVENGKPVASTVTNFRIANSNIYYDE